MNNSQNSETLKVYRDKLIIKRYSNNTIKIEIK